MTRLNDGRLAAVFRAGAPHIGRAGRLDWITSSDSGKTWTKPQVLAESPEDDRNPAFGQLRDGTLILAYCILSGHDEAGTGLSKNRGDRIFDGVYTIRSRDGGKRWSRAVTDNRTSRPRGAGAGTRAVVAPYGEVVPLRDGSGLMAVYSELTLPDGSQQFQRWVCRSKDRGETWNDPSLIQVDGDGAALAVLSNGSGVA